MSDKSYVSSPCECALDKDSCLSVSDITVNGFLVSQHCSECRCATCRLELADAYKKLLLRHVVNKGGSIGGFTQFVYSLSEEDAHLLYSKLCKADKEATNGDETDMDDAASQGDVQPTVQEGSEILPKEAQYLGKAYLQATGDGFSKDTYAYAWTKSSSKAPSDAIQAKTGHWHSPLSFSLFEHPGSRGVAAKSSVNRRRFYK